jgi:HK97 family phage portal protein
VAKETRVPARKREHSSTLGAVIVRGPTRLISDAAFMSGQDVGGPVEALSFNRIAASHAWVYACCRAISQNIAGVPVRFTTGKLDNLKEFTVDDRGNKGELVQLFDQPNQWMTGFQMWELTTMLMNLDGSAFWALERNDITQIPKSILVLRATNFTPVYSEVNGSIVSWIYQDPYTQNRVPLSLAQTLMFKFANPYDPVWGLSPLAAASRGVILDMLAAEYSRAFFENSADPSGVIVSEKRLSETQANQIISWWESRHRGAGTAKKIGILYGGMKYQTTGISQKDMEFLEQRKWTRDEVLAVFKVPKSEISLFEDVNFSSSVSQDKGFWQKTLIPILKNYESVLSAHFVTGLRATVDPNLRISFDLKSVSALQPDFSEQLKAAEALNRIGYPINDINERLKLGMPKKDWGDTWFLNSALITVEDAIAGVGKGVTDATGAPVPGQAKPSHPSVPGSNGKVPPSSTDPNVPKDPKPPSASGQTKAPVAAKKISQELSIILRNNEEILKSELKAYFWRLRAHQLSKALEKSEVYDHQVWGQKLSKRLQPLLSDMLTKISTNIGKPNHQLEYTPPEWFSVMEEQLKNELMRLSSNPSEDMIARLKKFFNHITSQENLTSLARMEIHRALGALDGV